MAQRRRPREVDPDIMAAVEAEAAKGFGGKAILERLTVSPAFKGRALPSLRTIQSIVADLTVADSSGEWSLADDEDEGAEAAFVLEVIRVLTTWSEGTRRAITHQEARWLRRIHRAVNDLDPLAAYLLTRAYVRAQQRGEPTSDLDLYLAFAPWRFDQAAEDSGEGGWVNLPAYREAVDKKWLRDERGAFSREALRLGEEFEASNQSKRQQRRRRA